NVFCFACLLCCEVQEADSRRTRACSGLRKQPVGARVDSDSDSHRNDCVLATARVLALASDPANPKPTFINRIQVSCLEHGHEVSRNSIAPWTIKVIRELWLQERNSIRRELRQFADARPLVTRRRGGYRSGRSGLPPFSGVGGPTTRHSGRVGPRQG